MKICFAASSGGHLEELMMLRPLMERYDSILLTEKTSYEVKSPVQLYYIPQVNRKEILFPIKLLCIFFKCWRIYLKEKPDAYITTGALATIPMALICKMAHKKLIYIESFARVSSGDMTGNFLHRFADRFYVQWPDMLKVFPDAIYKGGIF